MEIYTQYSILFCTATSAVIVGMRLVRAFPEVTSVVKVAVLRHIDAVHYRTSLRMSFAKDK